MKTIDARQWDLKARNVLEEAAASGGAILQLDDNQQIVVIDVNLWNHLQRQLPSLAQILHRFHNESSNE